uniref:Predicted protein n=1 Tax=Hordeum vulgare subsp. vulgare TaxID=112509 RepID=F2ELS0_HORVV|nr:predicted protein [Hordeum vulgare subsp. vulgare]
MKLLSQSMAPFNNVQLFFVADEDVLKGMETAPFKGNLDGTLFSYGEDNSTVSEGGNDEHMANVGFASSCKSLFVDYETCLVLLGVDTLVPSSDNVPFSMP